jgi:hypothetical protein
LWLQPEVNLLSDGVERGAKIRSTVCTRGIDAFVRDAIELVAVADRR